MEGERRKQAKKHGTEGQRNVKGETNARFRPGKPGKGGEIQDFLKEPYSPRGIMNQVSDHKEGGSGGRGEGFTWELT